MESELVARRRDVALLQHQRVMEEANFVAQLSLQARNRRAATAQRPRPAVFADDVRARVDWHLVS